MTLARLKEKMLYQLQGFVKPAKRDAIGTDTVHDDILDLDGTPTSSAELYKTFVVLSARLEATKLRRWPAADAWLAMTIDELAPKLLPKE